MANLHEPQTVEILDEDSSIADAVVRRLIDGGDTETLAFYDVSDCQIYGRKHRCMLSGDLAAGAKSVGCSPTVYQTVLWFCIVYIPVWPLGTYIVMPVVEYEDLHDEAVQYRSVRVSADTGQIALHYSALATLIATAIALGCWWF